MRIDEIIEMLAALKRNTYTIDTIVGQDVAIEDITKENFNFIIDESIKLINWLSDHKTQWEEIKI